MARKKKAEAVRAEEIKEVKQAAEPAEKKRGGRKPMSDDEKAALAKQRAELKAKADSMVLSLGQKKLGCFGASYLYPVFVELGICC